MDKDKTYSAKAKCPNCKNEEIVQVPFGVRLSSYEPMIKCDYCGCNCILVPVKEY